LEKKNILTYLLLPLSWIYGVVVYLRNKCFDLGILKEEEFEIPIISVGNITVGGTGKTPHIEYLIRLLKNEYKIAVLSRGYKRKTKGFILSDEQSDAETIGDEPCQIKRKFPDIVVAVDSSRRRGITNLLNSGENIDLILLDDAFQHRYVKPGLSILLIDFNRPVLEDYLLPFGQLREPVSAIERADIILVSKTPANLMAIDQRILVKNINLKNLQYLYFTTVARDELLPVFWDSGKVENHEIPGSKPSVLLVSGIANPAGLRALAMEISSQIIEKQYSDHHAFTAKDILAIISDFESINAKDKIIITTEKDAARFQKYTDLPESIKNRMFYIPIKIEFLNEDEENFNNHIFSYVRSNKRNSILHTGKDKI
jgi:tetraacyldisaccharide 4'-kinase